MPTTTEEVRVGVDGIVAVAPSETTAPTSATSTMPVGAKDLGYVSEDGVEETTERSTTPLKAWQRGKTVRTLVEDASVRYHLVLIQTSAETVALYYGGTVEPDGSIVVDPGAERPVQQLWLDVIDGDDIIRAWAPEAQVVEVGGQVFKNGEPIGYDVTIECARNATLGGSVKKFYSALDTTGA